MAQRDDRLSTILLSALDVNCDGRVTVGEILDRVSDHSFGLLIVLLAIPTLIPVLPPGSAAVIGLIYSLIALQMLIGFNRPWMPEKVRRYALSQKMLNAIRQRGSALMQKIERYSRPRCAYLDNLLTRRLAAIVLLAMGILLFLPIPFFNSIPALAVMALGIGLLNRDGVWLIGGMLACTLCVSLVVIVALLFPEKLASVWQQAQGKL